MSSTNSRYQLGASSAGTSVRSMDDEEPMKEQLDMNMFRLLSPAATSTAASVNDKPSAFQDFLTIRLFVLICLTITAVCMGYGSFYVLSQLQTAAQEEQYYALVRKIESATIGSVRNRRDALTLTGRLSLHFCPNVTMWPTCAIPFDLFDSVAESLRGTSSMRSISTAVLIQPSQITEFEDFNHEFYVKGNHYPSAYKSLGVYAVNITTGKRYHDTTGLQQKGSHSDYQILTPVFQIGDMPNNAAAVMFNLHSERRRAKAIDYALDCVRLLEDAGGSGHNAEVDSATSYHRKVAVNCTSITEVVFLVQDPPLSRPASLTLYPIIAYNDGNVTTSDTLTLTGKKTPPREIVGFVSAVHNWDTVLSISTNDNVNGILAVLSNGVESHTFIYDNGIVKYISKGDVHDSKYNSQRYDFDASNINDLSSILTSSSLYESSIRYTVTLYPTKEWIEMYEDSIPAVISGVVVGLVFFTSLVFSSYAYMVHRDANEKSLVLETKRQFVRYISHEIRTPLNVVFLGFQLLCTEMLSFSRQEQLIELETENDKSNSKVKLKQTNHKVKDDDNDIPIGTDNDNDDDATAASTTPETSLRTINQHNNENTLTWRPKKHLYSNHFKEWLSLIQDIVESADASLTVLNDLLIYDKLDSDSMIIDRELLPIWELINNTIIPFRVQAKAKNIELELILEDIGYYNTLTEHPAGNNTALTMGRNVYGKGKKKANVSKIVPMEGAESDGQVQSTNEVDLEAGQPQSQVSRERGNNNANPTVVCNQLVLGDKAKISQVLRNLVSNALKFTPSGGKVTIHAYWKPHGLRDAYQQLYADIITMKKDKGAAIGGRDEAIDLDKYTGCGSIVISVVDTGPGIAADNLAQLFLEGMQFNAGKLQAGQGSGLGLWISKGIAELHRGRLLARSDGEGLGSTLTVELPVLLPKAEQEGEAVSFSSRIKKVSKRLVHHEDKEIFLNQQQQVNETKIPVKSTAMGKDGGNLVVEECNSFSSRMPPKPTNTTTTTTTATDTLPNRDSNNLASNMSIKKFGNVDLITSFSSDVMKRYPRILVVDDNETIRKMVCRSLSSLGFQCQQAEDGIQCLDLLKRLYKEGQLKDEKHGIDLVLMDFEMPRSTGPTTVTKIRDIGIPVTVVGITGNVLKEDSEYYIQCGADKVMHKPFSIQSLETVLLELIQKDK